MLRADICPCFSETPAVTAVCGGELRVFWFALDKCQVPTKTTITPPPQLDKGDEM